MDWEHSWAPFAVTRCQFQQRHRLAVPRSVIAWNDSVRLQAHILPHVQPRRNGKFMEPMIALLYSALPCQHDRTALKVAAVHTASLDVLAGDCGDVR